MFFKRMILLCTSGALLLAACAPAAPGANTYGARSSVTPAKTRPAATSTAPSQPAGHEPGCTVVSKQPTPTPITQSLIPAVSAQDRVQGKTSAFVTIVEYSDFQCARCAAVAPVLARLAQQYPNDLRVVFRHFPIIGQNDKAALSAQAAEAAAAQGKFWEMHDLLYSRQAEWSGMESAAFRTWLERQAGTLKLDVNQFKKDLDDPAIVKKVQEAWEKNSQFIPVIPYLLINGQPYDGRLTYGDLNATVALTLLARRQFQECPPLTIDPSKQYRAILHTAKGDLTLELFADQAPLAVNNFIFLAKAGWYNNVTFHRVIPGFMAQAGDPTGTGLGGPGYAFDNEISDQKFDRPGVLGMANAGPGSNGSQFFITYAAAPHLNGGYTIFGQLVEGMDVLTKLTPRDPSRSDDLPPGDTITSVEIIEK